MSGIEIPEGADRQLYELYASELPPKYLVPDVKLSPIVNALWLPAGKTVADLEAATLPEENPNQKYLDFVVKPRRIAYSKAMRDWNDCKITLQIAEQEYSEMKFDDPAEEAEAKEKKTAEIDELKEQLPALESALTEFKTTFDPDPLSFVPWMNSLIGLMDSGMTSFEAGGPFWPNCDQFSLFGTYSDMYTESEKLFGLFKKRAEVERGAGSVTFFTKILPNIFREGGAAEEAITERIEASLANLEVESLDMVQMCWWDSDSFDPVPSLRVLKGLKDEGKIKAIGVLGFPASAIKKAIYAGIPIAAASFHFSMVDQSNKGLLDLCKREGITVLATGCLLGGLISDKFVGAPKPTTADPDVDSSAEALDKIDRFGGWSKFQKLLAAVQQVSTKHNVTMATVGLRWIMDMGATPVVRTFWEEDQFTQVGYPGHRGMGPACDSALMQKTSMLDDPDKITISEAC